MVVGVMVGCERRREFERKQPFKRPDGHHPETIRQRYPYTLKGKTLSITMGMWCEDGVLLCADRLYTGDIRLEQTKLFSFEYDGGSVVFALAGNEGYARLAIQESREKILACPTTERSLANVRRIIAKVVRSVYVEHIDTRPPHEQYESQIDLIVAIWSVKDGLGLFATRKTALLAVDNYECLGSGSYLARYLLHPVYRDTANIRQACTLCAQALDAIKGHDPHCGGGSEFLLITKEGAIEKPVRSGGLLLDMQMRAFQTATQELLLALTGGPLTDNEFDQHFNVFENKMADFYNRVEARFSRKVKP